MYECEVRWTLQVTRFMEGEGKNLGQVTAFYNESMVLQRGSVGNYMHRM